MKKNDLCALAETWGAPYVARREVYRFSGDIVTPRHLANEDSRGTGPVGKITVNGRVAYPTASLVAWLEARLKRETLAEWPPRRPDSRRPWTSAISFRGGRRQSLPVEPRRTEVSPVRRERGRLQRCAFGLYAHPAVMGGTE